MRHISPCPGGNVPCTCTVYMPSLVICVEFDIVDGQYQSPEEVHDGIHPLHIKNLSPEQKDVSSPSLFLNQT